MKVTVSIENFENLPSGEAFGCFEKIRETVAYAVGKLPSEVKVSINGKEFTSEAWKLLQDIMAHYHSFGFNNKYFRVPPETKVRDVYMAVHYFTTDFPEAKIHFQLFEPCLIQIYRDEKEGVA